MLCSVFFTLKESMSQMEIPQISPAWLTNFKLSLMVHFTTYCSCKVLILSLGIWLERSKFLLKRSPEEACPMGLILCCKESPGNVTKYVIVMGFLRFAVRYPLHIRLHAFAFLASELKLLTRPPAGVTPQFAVLQTPFLVLPENAEMRYLPLHWGRITVCYCSLCHLKSQ